MTSISPRTVLEPLTKARIAEIGRSFGLDLASGGKKDELVSTFANSTTLDLEPLLELLRRDELKAVCRAHGLDDGGRSRTELARRLLEAARPGSTPPHPPRRIRDLTMPERGDIVHVRHRQYLVVEVLSPTRAGENTLVRLVCLDDDAQGEPLEVLWELELGARVLAPEAHGLGDVHHLDSPRAFAAYLHALQWNRVTATDARLFQAPFRAGIKLMNHQLTPLKKALELPRANLFIADDVGLGKTIEAGLVLEELLLRQRVDWALIVCPAAVSLQWQAEMEKRFGLGFELYNRGFVARRRQERGFATNPWGTHTRFIISYQTLRRPEYRDPLLQFLGDRVKKSLLILDEAHTVAPASASKYAVDSRLTRVVRDVAPRFENRLFLSATPHNGHSNSFAALLEILEPQRFTRGVRVSDPKRLEPVMVRRLKSDLREIGIAAPERKVIQIELHHDDGAWYERSATNGAAGARVKLAEGEPVELELSRLLAEYTSIARPMKGPGRLVFINLQKRLLSSIEAFWRTLKLHADNLGKKAEPPGEGENLVLPFGADDEEYGLDEEALEVAEGAALAHASAGLPAAGGRRATLVETMLEIASAHRGRADARVLALLSWIRRNQCASVKLLGATEKLSAEQRKWSDKRVIIFTEYADTKRFLLQLLRAAVEGTDRGEERIVQFHGGMSDEARDEVQRAWNAPPSEHPARILLATDAAREGVNLQAFCADLFHFDIPWNPARMEQRNGRIDRTLQPSPEVRCVYFLYGQRPEDDVLRTLVNKVERIQHELGSLGAVVMDRLADVLEQSGIDVSTGERLERAERVDEGARNVAKEEVEAQRQKQRLKNEIDEAGRILNASRKVLDFDPALLRETLDAGFALAGAGPLVPCEKMQDGGRHLEPFRLPDLPESWQGTLDCLRPARGRDEPFWEWRKKAPLPVVFEPPETMSNKVAHLHLSHPVVQRVLSRFLAQGYSAHDLGRVTIVRNPRDSIERMIAFGRLSLFGPGATRLHDEIVAVAAVHQEGGGAGHLKPFSDEDDKKALGDLDRLLAKGPSLDEIPEVIRKRRHEGAASDFAALWPHVEAEAESREHEARQKLLSRAEAEARAMREILRAQRESIEATLESHAQRPIFFTEVEKEEREQYEQDEKYMRRRLDVIEKEIDTEPDSIAELYRVVLRRVEPVGLVYLWPGTR